MGVYKEDLVKIWKIKKFNLDDLYVRFFRLAERKLYEHSKRGVLCYVSNASYVQDPSFVVFRERMSHEFDQIDIDNLNGDSRETGKLTPDGRPDPSVFSTARNREGIRVGTAIGLFVLKSEKTDDRGRGRAHVRWREFWGGNKRQELLDVVGDDTTYGSVALHADTRWSFRPTLGSKTYAAWPKVTELCANAPISGLAEMRRGGLLGHSSEIVKKRMRAYFDSHRLWEQVRHELGGLEHDAGRYPAEATRKKLLDAGERFRAVNVRPYALLPLDNRWCYHSTARPLWNEPRPALAEQACEDNRFLVTRMNSERPREAMVALITTALPDYHLLRPNTVAIPFLWDSKSKTPNLNSGALAYVNAMGANNASALWYHAVAMTASPLYQSENAAGLRSDFPRIPLPVNAASFLHSATLGERLANLLDPMADVEGVTIGTLPASLRVIGSLRRSDGKKFSGTDSELSIKARWSIVQRKDVVMPGTGKMSEASRSEKWGGCVNVWLNDDVFWADIPVSAWEFTIGGYQALKKWLSYRTLEVLGRPLDIEEAAIFGSLCKRVAAVVDMWETLDESYKRCAGEHGVVP